MKLALLVAAWLIGIFLGLNVGVGPLPVLLLALAAIPAALLLRMGQRSIWPAALALVLLVGLWRVEAIGEVPNPLAIREKQTVTLTGRIVDDPEAAARRVKFTLEVDGVDQGAGMVSRSGEVLVYADPPPSVVSLRDGSYFRFGDVLRLEGVLMLPRPFGDFDYPAYLASQGISGVFFARDAELLPGNDGPTALDWRGWIFALRGKLSESLQRAMTVPQSALAQALLLGLRGQLPPEVVEDFRGTGTAHLLAISGLHVGVLLVMSMAAAAGVLGRRRQLYLLAPLVSIWLYALVSGLPVSVVRAAIMGTVYLAAFALGRPRSALAALAFAAAVMAGITPNVLQQISFQLSFAALAGIILALPYQARISNAFGERARLTGTWWQAWRWQASRWVLTALTISLAATLATWPLVAFNFGRVPLLGIFATLMALPALPLILAGSLATAVLGLAHPLLGQFFGWLTWLPLSYLLGLVSLAPAATISGAWVSTPLAVAWYVVLGGLLLLPGGLGRIKRLALGLNRAVERWAGGPSATVRYVGPSLGLVAVAAAVLVAVVFLWLQALKGPDGKLHVFFFDVGQGDSALIVTPGGKQVLVDGGPESESATRALAASLEPGDRSLDLVVATHMDADHSRGLLEVVDRYRVALVLTGADQPGGTIYPQWQAALKRRKVQTLPVSAGYLIKLEPGISLEVLNPPPAPFRGSLSDGNNNGVVFRLVHGQISYLLASDIEAMAENYLVRNSPALRSTVLKVPHHGSRTSTTVPFLERVRPSLGVISVGADNRYGHPNREVVTRLEETSGAQGILRTDRNGDIELISDGASLWVRTESNPR